MMGHRVHVLAAAQPPPVMNEHYQCAFEISADPAPVSSELGDDLLIQAEVTHHRRLVAAAAAVRLWIRFALAG